MPQLIQPDQRGFISGRCITDSILDLYAVLDIVLENDNDFLIYSVDIWKAFDSLDWDCLCHALGLFGFPLEFLTWFNIFYADRTVQVSYNREVSEPIRIEKGNFQGCPLSPLFFALAIEILSIRIRNNKEIIGVKFQHLEKR